MFTINDTDGMSILPDIGRVQWVYWVQWFFLKFSSHPQVEASKQEMLLRLVTSKPSYETAQQARDRCLSRYSRCTYCSWYVYNARYKSHTNWIYLNSCKVEWVLYCLGFAIHVCPLQAFFLVSRSIHSLALVKTQKKAMPFTGFSESGNPVAMVQLSDGQETVGV